MKQLLNLILFCGLVLAPVCLAAQPAGRNEDPEQRRYREMAGSDDPAQREQLKEEMYSLIKNQKTEQNFMTALRYFDLLKMNATTDSLVKVIKKRFPKGNLARNTEISTVYNEKDPLKKEALFAKYLKKFPPEKYSDKLTFDYGRFDVASSFAQAGNMAKALEYADQMETESWICEGWASLARVLLGVGNYDNAATFIKKSLDKLESGRLQNEPNGAMGMARNSYPSYCALYGEILYNQKKHDEAFKYMDIKKSSSRGLTPYEDLIYIRLLAEVGRKVEAFMALDALAKGGTATDSDIDLYIKLYTDLNGSDKGLENIVAELRRLQEERVKAKVAKEMINIPAPLFEAKDVDSNHVSLSELKGKIVIIDFWATWCSPCKRSFPGMQAAVDKYKGDEDVVFLFIHTWEKEENPTQSAIDYLKENNYSFRLIMDLKDPVTKTNELVTSYKVVGIPTKFIIDKDGNIRYKVIGSSSNVDEIVMELSAMIESVR